MSEELTQAELFDVFSNARRRQTVRYLKRYQGTCDLAPLVEQVAAWENDTETEAVTRTQRRRVYISLYQTHLPMLEEHGIVDWDPDAHRIELLPSEDTFEPYLDRQLNEQRSWHLFYASVTLVGGLLFVLALLSIGVVSPSIAPLIALGVCFVIAAIALTQYVSRQPAHTLPFGLGR
ncbi:hypothetical protein ACLI4R_00135 [Natrialbaceae archaeon A-chndr2]